VLRNNGIEMEYSSIPPLIGAVKLTQSSECRWISSNDIEKGIFLDALSIGGHMSKFQVNKVYEEELKQVMTST
jgi:hypothetical protein